MAFNVMVVKKYSAFLLAAFIPIVCWNMGMLYYNLIGAVGFFAIGLILAMFICPMLISHPFRDVVEGKGILIFNIDSTGIIKPFIAQVASPFIKAKLGGKQIVDSFDRSTVFNLAHPSHLKHKINIFKKGQKVCYNKGTEEESICEMPTDCMNIAIDYETLNSSRFGLYHFPVLIYNEQIGSFITKEFLAGQELDAFAKHGVLYLNRKIEELTSAVRDFGRHVVESLKPGVNIFQNRWVQIALIIAVLVIIALFAKPFIGAIGNFGGGATSAISNPGQGAFTPV